MILKCELQKTHVNNIACSKVKVNNTKPNYELEQILPTEPKPNGLYGVVAARLDINTLVQAKKLKRASVDNILNLLN